MSKVNAPLLSFGASGQIAKTQVYSTWKGRPYVRQYVVPSNPDSAGQQLTRNTFRFLTNLYKFLPAGAVGAWALYAQNSRFTPVNGFIKQNLGPLREETDLVDMVMSVSAGSGLVATDVSVTPGDAQVLVELDPPSALPAGWSIVRAHAMAIRNVDPQQSATYDVIADDDDTAPYAITLTGLTNDETYIVGGWFEYARPGGFAYGPSLQDTAMPQA